MSFSGNVKEELSRQLPNARHCLLAELAAIMAFSSEIYEKKGFFRVKIYTENVTTAKKIFTLLKKTYNINTEISIKKTEYPRGRRAYVMWIDSRNGADELLHGLKLIDGENQLVPGNHLVNGTLIQKTCCKRAFVRGAFLAAGSISDPEKSYHFEIPCDYYEQAEELKDLINTFDLDAKIVQRKKIYVVYIKESAQIVEILNVMEAHVALMELENIRILKDMRNTVNRKVNCETANLNKTVNAAVKQVEDIQLISKKIGLENLSEGLRQIAEARLENPDVPLKELGEMLDPPVGKSGVNHRLRKLSQMADDLRE